MKKKLTINCDDNDSLDLQNQRRINTTKHQRRSRSPMYMTNKSFKFNHLTLCQTPQSQNVNKQSFDFKSPKYVGVVQKTILQRLQFYDKRNKQRMLDQQMSTKMRQQEFCIQQLQDKPQINQISKNLFQKVKKQRRLSPNILQRFQTYECQRVQRTAKYELMKTYGMIVKNNTPTCRKLIKLTTARSALKQKSCNRQKSKSFERNQICNLQKTMSKPFKTKQYIFNQNKFKNQQNIGKLVKNMQKSHFDRQQKSFKLTPTKNEKKYQTNYKSGFLKSNQHNSKKFNNCQNSFQINKVYINNQLNKNHQQMVIKGRISPLNNKKAFNNPKKWKVIT